MSIISVAGRLILEVLYLELLLASLLPWYVLRVVCWLAGTLRWMSQQF